MKKIKKTRTELSDDRERPSLWALYSTFFKIGIMMFGGGLAMLPILQREIDENKHWATETELADYYAIGQCTPGIIAVNTVTFVGNKKRGVIGAIVATLGLVSPSLLIIMTLAGIIEKYDDLPIVQDAFAGIRVAVVVLIFNAVVKIGKTSIIDIPTLLIFIAVAAGSLFINVSPVVFVLIAAAAGIVIAKIKAQRSRLSKGGEQS